MAGWADWDLWGLPTGSQGYETNAKDDTLYYGRDDGGGIADLATDLGQYAVNQSAQRGYHYEVAPAARFDVTTSWAAEFDVDANDADTGRFFTYDCVTAASDHSLQITAGGVINAIVNSTTVGSITLPGISGSNQNFIVAWTASPNPYTTGAADAVRSELRAWNIATGAYTQSVFNHVARPAQTGAMVFWASSTAGANVFGGIPNACRFSTGRPRTSTETHEDFVALTAAPTLELATRCEFPCVEPGHALGAAGSLVGPAHFMVAQAVKQNQLRTFSPIVNEHYLNRTAITLSSFTEIPARWRTTAPDGDYTMMGPWMFYRPVPPTATHLRARVFVKHWNNGEVGVRVYSMNRPPTSQDVVDQGTALVQAYASESVSTDHGSGGTDGEWLEFDLIEPQRNSEDHTWIFLGIDAIGNPGTGVFEIGAIVVEPGVVE